MWGIHLSNAEAGWHKKSWQPDRRMTHMDSMCQQNYTGNTNTTEQQQKSTTTAWCPWKMHTADILYLGVMHITKNVCFGFTVDQCPARTLSSDVFCTESARTTLNVHLQLEGFAMCEKCVQVMVSRRNMYHHKILSTVSRPCLLLQSYMVHFLQHYQTVYLLRCWLTNFVMLGQRFFTHL